MIYHKKYLLVKLLLENVSNKELKGFYRPVAYIKGVTDYCTECQFELMGKPLETGENRIVNAVLYAPHGYGEHLKEGIMLTLQNGIQLDAKAIILEITGYKN